MPGKDSCPRGYRYYSCRSNDFKGCCSVNPCSLSECPASFLSKRSQEDQTTSSDMDSGTTASTPLPSSSTKTDSGVTHTIPNNSVVTVTKHTVVFSEAPLSTESSSSTPDTTSEAPSSTVPCSTCTPPPTFTSSPSTDVSGEGGISSGAIAGAATGGAIILIIVLIWVFVLKRRKKQRGSCAASETEALGCDSRVNGSEKWNASPAGPLRPSSDPFAPFGGRVDQPEELRAPSGTFEMDGTGITAVELPAVSISEAPDTARGATSLEEASRRDTAATDPAATLASPASPRGTITYVNQWNQYKAMAAASEQF